MDADFIAYYKENINFLREKSEIFAQQYPTIAKNLGLSSFECADPFVERVLEGVAFLAARNEQKLDQGATFLLQDLLSTLAPALALPHPALGNFQLTNADKTLSFAQGTQFKTSIKKTDCKFSTLFKVDITPAVFSEPQQHFQPLNPGFSGKSSLSLQLDINSVQNLPDDIEIYLNLPELEAGLVAQWLTLNLCGVYFKVPPTSTPISALTAVSTAPSVSAVSPAFTAFSASARTQAPSTPSALASIAASASTSAAAAMAPGLAAASSQSLGQSPGQNPALDQPLDPGADQSSDAWNFAGSAQQPILQGGRYNPLKAFGSLGNVGEVGTVGTLANSLRLAEPELIPLQVSTVSPEQTRLEQELTAAGLSPNTIAQAFFNGANLGATNQEGRAENSEHVLPGNAANATVTATTAAIANLGHSALSLAHTDSAAGGARAAQATSGIKAELSILAKPNLLGELLGTGNGINYLTLYTAYPQLCKYVVLKGLGKALRQINVRSGRVIFAFNTQQPKLNLGHMPFLTNVLPLINLFPKRCSYTQLSMRAHYHVIPERTQPDDFEVVTISSLEILGSDHVVAHTALPFFNQSLEPDQLFFIQERHERTKGTFIPRSSYMKSECFVTLCGAKFQPLLEPHLSMVANTYCSNADLPLFIRQGQKLKTLDESAQVRLLDLKLNVEPALIMRSNQQSYALLAYFNLHLHNLISQSESQIQLRLQELIKAYAAPHGNPELELLAQALYSVEKTPKTFRHLQQGIVFFEPGLQIKLYFDPEKSGGSSLFFFARILCAMLQSFVPLNEHCEVLAYTKQGVILTHSVTFNESSR